MCMSCHMSLNPFENQVYFYRKLADDMAREAWGCLNPFENQVYFYLFAALVVVCFIVFRVLIPLRIRSISTQVCARLLRQAFQRS